MEPKDKKILSPAALAKELGERLKRTRLNRDITQADIASLAGVSRKAVINAEKGDVRLDIFIAILAALDLTQALEHFLPEPPISPIQLLKQQSKEKQRASGNTPSNTPELSAW